jgi:hypothetical protein
MPIFPVADVGKYGIIKDLAPHELPVPAWSGGNNVRFDANFVEKIAGYQQVFGSLSVPPLNSMFTPSLNTLYWLYFGEDKAYATDGNTHYNITRQSTGVDVDYTGTALTPWIGGVLGGIPVITNGVDVPQYFAPVSLSTKLQNLTNWPSGVTCKVIRPFKQYLLALNITKNTDEYPFMLKWSHPAAPGTVPVTWDETDPTYDAGEYDFAEDNGVLLDAVPLRDIMVVYREGSVWGMQAIADASVFRFFRMFNSFGALSVNCAVEFLAGKHLVFSTNDILVHDGQNAQSILQDRLRKEIFQDIDSTYYARSFVARILSRNEVWCCYPTAGSSWPNKALVWNWITNALSIRALPEVSHVVPGIIPAGTVDDTWGSTDSWNTDSQTWNERSYNPSSDQHALISFSGNAMYNARATESFGGTPFSAWVERTGIGIPFKQGQPPDMTSMKFLRNVWPRFNGTQGGIVQVTIGFQMEIDGPVTWGTPQNYVIGTTKKIDCLVSGRLFAIRFSSDTELAWRLQGYELDVSFGGHW